MRVRRPFSGGPANDVFYIQSGRVKLSVLSRAGKEAVVAILGPGDFFGERCLAAEPRRIGIASAMTASTALIEKPQMVALLRTEPSLPQRFLAHMLVRKHPRGGESGGLCCSTQQEPLARVLLLVARYGINKRPLRIPKMSQETLAEIVGTTRWPVNLFMNSSATSEQLPAQVVLHDLARHPPPPVHLETARRGRCPYSGSQENR
jgi:CRP-like cAMP-binding protein